MMVDLCRHPRGTVSMTELASKVVVAVLTEIRFERIEISVTWVER